MALNERDAQIAVNGAFAQAEAGVLALVAQGVIEVDATDFYNEVGAAVDQLGRIFAQQRLAASAEIAGSYPAAQRGGGGNRGSYSKPAGGAPKTVSNPGADASDKQIGLIKRLLNEKDHNLSIDTDGLTMGEASAHIDTLMALPNA